MSIAKTFAGTVQSHAVVELKVRIVRDPLVVDVGVQASKPCAASGAIAVVKKTASSVKIDLNFFMAFFKLLSFKRNSSNSRSI